MFLLLLNSPKKSIDPIQLILVTILLAYILLEY